MAGKLSSGNTGAVLEEASAYPSPWQRVPPARHPGHPAPLLSMALPSHAWQAISHHLLQGLLGRPSCCSSPVPVPPLAGLHLAPPELHQPQKLPTRGSEHACLHLGGSRGSGTCTAARPACARPHPRPHLPCLSWLPCCPSLTSFQLLLF